MDDIIINTVLIIPVKDLKWQAARASGAGGQNVNKVSSKVELRFFLEENSTLPVWVKDRLKILAKNRLDAEGNILLVSQVTRDQHKNLEDVCEKLKRLVLEALETPKPRKATRPSRSSKEKRIKEKQIRGGVKQLRQKKYEDG